MASLLFGFTYLWFGLIQVYDLEPQGFGWYSAFVAAIAAYHAVKSIGPDPVSAAMWAVWALMWTLFFVLLGLGVTKVRSFDVGRFNGWVLILLGVPTSTLPAIFLLNGSWTVAPAAGAAALVALIAALGISAALAQRARSDEPARTSSPTVVGTAVDRELETPVSQPV